MPSKSAPADSPNTTGTPHRNVLNAQGRHGRVRFVLQRVSGGLYVEREEIPHRGLRATQSITFTDPTGFERWCDGDSVRFEHPLLYSQLKREGDELWRIMACPDEP